MNSSLKRRNDFLIEFTAKYDANDVLRYLEDAWTLKILVVGEAIIDEYQFCEAIGKSSKEPMLALKHISTEKFAGGILAIANHLANFCDHVNLLTFLGTKNSWVYFIRGELNPKIGTMFLQQKDSPTIVKRRLIDDYSFAKLIEVYEMNDSPLSESDNARLCSVLRTQIPKHDIVIVADYGHGMISEEAVEILCNNAHFLAINTQANAGNWGYHTVSKYPRADYVCIAEQEMRLEARDRQGGLGGMILDVSRKLNCERMIVTRGNLGCLCYAGDEHFLEIPALASVVIDRMGGGDAFFALSALCAAQGAPMEIIGFIGNIAGGLTVETVGHQKSIIHDMLIERMRFLYA